MNPRDQVSGWGVGVGVGAAFGHQAPRGKAMSQADGISSVNSWRASADVKQRVVAFTEHLRWEHTDTDRVRLSRIVSPAARGP
jgi:hypothetical protein